MCNSYKGDFYKSSYKIALRFYITCPPIADTKKGNSYTMNLAACGGMFFDRMNKINKIFLYSLYLPAGRQVLNILSKKWDFYIIKLGFRNMGSN